MALPGAAIRAMRRNVPRTLRHRAAIERDENFGQDTDAGGDPVAPDWQPHLTNLHCWAFTSAAKEVLDGEQTAVIEDRRMVVELGTDVNPSDRVASVNDLAGGTVFEGPMAIESVVTHASHLELALERIR